MHAVVITLEAKIPPAYPNEVPELDVVVVKGLTEVQRKTLLDLANEKVILRVMRLLFPSGFETSNRYASCIFPVKNNV